MNTTITLGLLTSDLSHKHGWAHYSLSLIEALHQQGIQTRIITAHNSPQPDGLTIQPWLPTVTPPDRYTLPQLLQNIPRVRQYLADCNVLHTTIEPYAPLLQAIAGKRPYFVTAHGSYIYLPRMRRFPIGALYARAFRQSTLVCVSDYTARVARQLDPRNRTVVIGNAIDASRYDDIPLDRAPDARPTVISVGGVKHRKGTLQLVQAMAQVRDHVPDVRCVIIGDTDAKPAYSAQVRAEITRLNLQDTVELVGFVTEKALHQWYTSAHIFALPAMNDGWHFEGYGLVVLEASAAGLPVIGTRDCGVEDAILHEKTGLLVDQARVQQELAPALIRLFQDKALARSYGAAGRAFAQSRTWASVASALIDQYQGAL